MISLIDMHMHIGFVDSPQTLAHELARDGVAAFSNTVTPAEYLWLESELEGCSNLARGLGFHPWQLDGADSQTAAEMLDVFETTIDYARLIGEIGLDFLPKHSGSRMLQIKVFERIAQLCAQMGDCLLSIHSIRAEREVLDTLEKSGCFDSCKIILHSYAGSSDQLKRALDLGCFFSIGPRMLSTKKGREYARIIPQDRLLLETDLPERDGTDVSSLSIRDSLEESITSLCAIRGVERGGFAFDIFEHSKRLLEL